MVETGVAAIAFSGAFVSKIINQYAMNKIIVKIETDVNFLRLIH